MSEHPCQQQQLLCGAGLYSRLSVAHVILVISTIYFVLYRFEDGIVVGERDRCNGSKREWQVKLGRAGHVAISLIVFTNNRSSVGKALADKVKELGNALNVNL